MRDSFRFALDSVLCNRRRALITVAIIAIGVSALVGVQAALDIVARRVTGSFDRLGTGICTIRPAPAAPPITLHQACEFSRRTEEEPVAIWLSRTPVAIVRSGGAATDPVVEIVACDQGYLDCFGVKLSWGRNFSPSEVDEKQLVAIIGEKVRRKLFSESTGLGEWVSCDDGRYRVIGVIEPQGALFGSNLDAAMLIPIDAAYGGCSVSFQSSSDASAIARAGCTMSAARRLAPGAEPDFEIVRADSSQAVLDSLRSKLSLVALAIGLITMLGAAVGLMNSMLVSVRQRTREIGIRRALGAKSHVIARQFLMEAVIVGQAGCMAGVLLGLLLGLLVALGLEGDFVVPWRWIGVSVLISLAVSLASGLLPARRAATLNPIDALTSL